MPARQYPFIDIAVHERVREHFANGEAAILFSADMRQVLWANGRGAALFGFDAIYDLIDAGADRSDVSFRQLEATAAQLRQVGDRRNFLMRIASGFRRLTVNAEVEIIRVHAGDAAILFTAPLDGRPASQADCAQRMLSGFDDPDTHMAVLDADGEIVAASAGFRALGIAEQTRRMLVGAVGQDRDWLVKRPIATAKGHLPAAIGKISNAPSLHLLFAVETILGNLDPAPGDDTAEETAGDTPTGAGAWQPQDTADETPAPSVEEAHAPVTDERIGDAGASASEGGDAMHEAMAEEESRDVTPAEPEESASDLKEEPDVLSDETDALVGEPVDTVSELTDAHAAKPSPLADAAREDASAGAGEQPQGFRFDPNGRAVRFVWKIDATGRFSEISDEFAAAVGPRSADISGREFGAVADRYGFDADHKIRELLQRRDTWSGKTILWPAEGTDLVVPVDLAALPTYSRNREFDGFRGFGIVRVADAVADERALGLSLVDETPAPDETMQEEPGLNEDNTVEAAETGDAAAAERPDAGESLLPDEITAGDADAPATVEVPETGESKRSDVFRGERPVLRIVDPAARGFSEKIVQLEERRSRNNGDGLTSGEKAALQEIARQLGGAVGNASGRDEADIPPEPTDDRPHDRDMMQEPEEVTRDGVELPAEEEERLAANDGEAPVSLGPDVLDHMPVALLVHSGDVLHHANPEFLKLTGYPSLADLVEDGGIDALFVGDDDDLFDMPEGSMMMIRNDGHLVAVNARLQSIRWEGRAALMMALTHAREPAVSAEAPDEALAPVTVAGVDDDNALEALRIEADELRSILETATDGVVTLGVDGDIRSMNRSASALFNYDEAETRGKPFAMLFAHESQKAVLDYLGGLSGHGVASVLNDGREVIGREAGGGFIPLFMTMGRLSSSGYCAVIRDITQWKRTEEELRNAKRAAETANAHKTEFLARVSHEIRTPLNAIIGFSDMMASERLGPIGHARYVEYAGDIGRSGRHVLDIVNDLLDISKIEAGELELEFTAVGLNEMVSEAVSLVQPQANAQRVIVRTSLSNAVPSVVADSRSIKQIALNILANAIRFTQAGGQIVVSTAYEPNGSVVLRIRDTGVGMTRAELEQALKPFRQVTSGVRKQRGDGTGLGLPLTKAMVDANRALFSISSAPNEGTLVEVTFPSQRVLAD